MNTVILTIQSGVPVARIELLDEVQMKACVEYSDLEGFETKPTLFFEFHGSQASVEEQAEQVKAISDDFGGSAFAWSTRQEDRSKLWQARHDAYYAAMALGPGKKGMATDVCVPISKLADCILDTKRDIEETGLIAPIVGHVGDGNYHLVLLFDPDDADETKRAKDLVERMNHRAIAYGGTQSWKPEWAELLVAFDVIYVVGEGDEPGRQAAQGIAQGLHGVLGEQLVDVQVVLPKL